MYHVTIWKQVQPLLLQLSGNKWFKAACIAGCILSLRSIYLYIKYKINKYPPSLHGIPFIGSLLTMLIWNHNFNLQLLPKYGDIVHFNIGNLPFYKINDVDLAYKVYFKALNRPPMYETSFHLSKVEPTVGVINEDKQWSKRRKIMISNLNKTLNSRIVENNISKIFSTITCHEIDLMLLKGENHIYTKDLFINASFNSIYLAVFGKMLQPNDPLYKEYIDSIYCFFHIIEAIMYEQLPTFIGEPLFGNKSRLFKNGMKTVYNLVNTDYLGFKKQLLDSHDGDDSDDLINTVTGGVLNDYKQLNLISKQSEDRFIADIYAFLLGGTGATSHTMDVGVLLLAKNPKIQDIIFNQLSNVFFNTDDDNNKNKFVLSKMDQCPLLKAFCNEAIRIANPVPDAGGRSFDKDLRCLKYNDAYDSSNTNIICDTVDAKVWQSKDVLNIDKINIEYDYIIKKNSQIEINLSYILSNNKDLFNNELDLNNWIDENNKFVNNSNSIPFGIGRRDCLGKQLAFKELYSLFANLILRYKIIKIKNVNYDIKYNFGSISRVVTPPIPVQIEKRLVSTAP